MLRRKLILPEFKINHLLIMIFPLTEIELFGRGWRGWASSKISKLIYQGYSWKRRETTEVGEPSTRTLLITILRNVSFTDSYKGTIEVVAPWVNDKNMIEF